MASIIKQLEARNGSPFGKDGKPKPILGNSTKVELSGAVDRLTAVVYLEPALLCPFATAGCKLACLGHSTGHLAMSYHAIARAWKTLLFLQDRVEFINRLRKDVARLVKRADKLGKVPAVRLNGSSDIFWERVAPELFTDFPQVEWYDYTKAPLSARRNLPSNYHLTFSLSEDPKSAERASEYIAAGYSAALVVAGPIGTKKVEAQKVAQRLIAIQSNAISGDEHDHRPLDPAGSLVVLYAKGPKALKDTSGFVKRYEV